MAYQVACECGAVHPVSAGDAGTSVKCGCGRTFEVPTLHLLRDLAGESVFSPELRVEAMLKLGSWEAMEKCVCCGAPAERCLKLRVECELPVIVGEKNAQNALIGCLFGGWVVGLIVYFLVRKNPSELKTHGRDVRYLVPLQVCGECDSKIQNVLQLKVALRYLPECAALLDKYPQSSVSRAGAV